MDDDLLTYIRDREQACRLRASMCPVYDQSLAWLDRASEWAALADDIARQRSRGAELAPIDPALAARFFRAGKDAARLPDKNDAEESLD